MEKTFAEIDAMCDSVPRLAMSMLDSVDYGSLSTPDRHRYDLLSIKTRDKAYVRHTSDSLILDVIDYYQAHQKSGLYPEALYYGGRVYSDMGDLPTALTYFQKALDVIPDDKAHKRFKSVVLNQTGRLLHSLRLDSAAIGYLQKSLCIEKESNNDYGVAYTHKLLGKAYLNIHDLESAHRHIEHSLQRAYAISQNDKSSILIDLAIVLARKNQNDSALDVLKSIQPSIDSLDMPVFLAVAAETYREAGMIDSAYSHARQLISLPAPENKLTGYKVILSDDVRDKISKDSLVSVITAYRTVFESYRNKYEANNAIIQNTKYNYTIHERNRLRAEKKLYICIIIIAIACILVLMAAAVVLYKRFKRVETTATVATTINLLKERSEQSDIDSGTCRKDETATTEHSTEPLDLNNEVLILYDTTNPDDAILKDYREQTEDQCKSPKTVEETNDCSDCLDIESKEKLGDIKKKILSGINGVDKDLNSLVNVGITDAQIYKYLADKVISESRITFAEEKEIFKGVTELIESISHGFSHRLRIITEGKITVTETQIAMLIKCGFSPKQVATLLGKEMNTVSTHRRNLAHKITGKKKADCNLDLIIISI